MAPVGRGTTALMPKLWSQWGRSHSPHVQSVAPLGTGNSDVGEKIAQVSSSDVDEKRAVMASWRGAPHDVGEKNPMPIQQHLYTKRTIMPGKREATVTWFCVHLKARPDPCWALLKHAKMLA